MTDSIYDYNPDLAVSHDIALPETKPTTGVGSAIVSAWDLFKESVSDAFSGVTSGIGKGIQNIVQPSISSITTPTKSLLDSITSNIIWIVLAIVILIFVLGKSKMLKVKL